MGATGCVGAAIAEAFLHAGTTVFGLARSAAAAAHLTQNGIRPVLVGNVQDMQAWLPIAESCSVVVEALGDKGDKSTQKKVSEALIALRTREATPDGRKPNVEVIFTSGVFSYGQDDSDKLRVFTESDDDYSHSCKASLGRHPIERAYRAAGAIVISGSMVYGGGRGPLLEQFGSIIHEAKKNGSEARLASVFGDGSQWLTCVHRRDLGELYVLAASRAPELRGQLINACAHMERFDAIAESIAMAMGLPVDRIRYDTPPETDLKWRAYGANIRVSGQKARLLGWTPRQPSFCQTVADEVAAYVARGAQQH